LKFGEMEFGEMKRNTSNWSNFCILLSRAGLSASAGLSCSSYYNILINLAVLLCTRFLVYVLILFWLFLLFCTCFYYISNIQTLYVSGTAERIDLLTVRQNTL